MDGNGRTDVTLDCPGDRLWTRMNNASWVQRHGLNSIGDDEESRWRPGGRPDLLVDFRGDG
jgi:hypothetical protein